MLGAVVLNTDHQSLHAADSARAVKSAPGLAACYTVNDPERARELWAGG